MASSYLSSFLNTTQSKYQSIKQALISNEQDGDTEDDSHISRALRSYYTEKGRPFPEWLPPDPKAPPPPTPQPYATSSSQSLASQNSGRWQRQGGLNDLWDAPKQQQEPQQQQQMPQSLRPRWNAQQQEAAPPARMGSGRSNRFGDLYDSGSNTGRNDAGSRYSGHEQVASPALSTASGATTKDMLKAKLFGGRQGSPTPSAGSTGGGYQAPARQQSPGYNRTGGGSYDDGRSGGGYGDDRGGHSQPRPSQSSQSSWGGNSQNSMGGGGYGANNPYGQSQQRPAPGQQPQGLPSGPRPRRF